MQIKYEEVLEDSALIDGLSQMANLEFKPDEVIEVEAKHLGRVKGAKNLTTMEGERQRDIFNKAVDRKWKPLIKAQLEEALSAKGSKARQYLIDQRIGKPMERAKIEQEIEIVMDI